MVDTLGETNATLLGGWHFFFAQKLHPVWARYPLMHAMKSLKEQVLNQYIDAVHLQDIYIEREREICVYNIYYIISYHRMCMYAYVYWMHNLITNMYLQVFYFHLRSSTKS